ncbi:hypothetical protein [Ruixingdingia sedimenti]|uniref:YcxB-like protein n=1 Tax=Ruixingdingia sedimenti TaxID=3073604 RepID=A0ABU1F8B9_9RHOB|nr:hypothetical protein [Xinfangfangia sp. LG-4]MDR5653119.1 hypothetical protein [Xinfangfangia sp. LG-4]
MAADQEAGRDGDARAVPPPRVLRYRLKPLDALAWEHMQAAPTKKVRLGRMAPWIAVGLSYAVMMNLEVGVGIQIGVALAASVTAFVLAQYLLARDMQRRALLRVPAEVDMVCEAGGEADALTVWPEAAPDRAQVIPARAIRQIVTTPERLFLDAGEQVLILPHHAFVDEEDMKLFSARWRDAARNAPP